MPKFTRKATITVVTAALVLGVGGTAFAYWTQVGSGTGGAATGTTVPLIVNQTTVVTGLYPGVTPVTLSGTFDNPNAGEVKAGAVSATVTGTSVVGCDKAWYTIGGTSTPATQIVAAGTGKGTWTGLTVGLVNNAVNQDACKSATITIAYTVAAAA